MSHTKKLISDSVLYKLAGGVPPRAFPVHEQDIWAALDNKVNSLFKLKHFDTTLPSGETLPEAAMIATYEGVTVTSVDGGKSRATLPIVPISLPKNMGIYLRPGASRKPIYSPSKRTACIIKSRRIAE
jgi:hypothetical protein